MVISKNPHIIRKLIVRSALLAVMLLAYVGAFAADGDLDVSFAGTGKTTTATPTNYGIGTTVVVQPDGKTLVAGTVAEPTNFYPIFGVMRYNVDGSVDTSFATNGLATVDFFSFYLWSVEVVVQNDGKIVLAGAAAPLFEQQDMAIARLNPDGSLDTTFGVGGKFTCDFNAWNDGITDLVIQPDGKIVAAGYATGVSGYFDFAAIRVDTNGILDPSFGTGGKVVIDFAGVTDQANGVALQTDGKILLAGAAWFPAGTESDYAVARLNPDGTLDVGFGMGGKATVSFFSHDEGSAVAVQTDGKIVVGGSAGEDSMATADFGVTRLNPNGSLDTTFGTNGKTTTDFFAALDHAYDMLIQPDGKIVLVGDINPNLINVELYVDFGLARYDTSGNLDPTFGTGGKVTTDFGHTDYGGGVAFTPDCKIVAAGFSWTLETGGGLDFAVARYNSSGCPVEPPTTTAKCTKTQGYWKTHPEAWPVNTLTLGSQLYSKTELLSLLGTTSSTDASVTLARQLIAAKLNIANGSDPTPVSNAITASDAALSLYSGKLPYKVKSSSTNGQIMTVNAGVLTDYNGGLLTPVCVP